MINVWSSAHVDSLSGAFMPTRLVWPRNHTYESSRKEKKMSTDYFLIQGKDLIRLGTRGAKFHWLIDPTEIEGVEPFVVWDDFANEYTREEFELMLAHIPQTKASDYPNYPSQKVHFPNGTEDEYWSHKSPDSRLRDRYKLRVMGVQNTPESSSEAAQPS